MFRPRSVLVFPKIGLFSILYLKKKSKSDRACYPWLCHWERMAVHFSGRYNFLYYNTPVLKIIKRTPSLKICLFVVRTFQWSPYHITQSKSKTTITRSVHDKFNFITVKYNGTWHVKLQTASWLVFLPLIDAFGNLTLIKKFHHQKV